ncbi:MAG TPA: S24 family peptidase [Terriglobales bacterium]|jgi:SOS-response transcriptional repressor LexA|nr:S24 family peptidase [Terriglobales bacterium]
MKFKALQENLRKVLWARIEAGELTGLRLAEQTGFQQAHISNFLNRKRSLSLTGMDKVLTMQHLSVLDLLDPEEINKRASILPPSEDEFENLLLVEGNIAATEPLIQNQMVQEILKYKKSFLRRLRPEPASPRDDWRRFVLIKVDARDGMSMWPRLLPGAIVLIDRHYNSLKPYHRNEQNMYAVRKDDMCTVKYAEEVRGDLVLKPHNPAYPADVIEVEEDKTFADYVVGRVCHVAVET